VAVGYGKFEYGNQLIDWNKFTTDADNRGKPVDKNTHISSLLEHFTGVVTNNSVFVYNV
jgi:hypothetical protein